tara:strand:+ start:100 stop:570 length:471 start_codon:yes stop_codon:yes gene_type:complete
MIKQHHRPLPHPKPTTNQSRYKEIYNKIKKDDILHFSAVCPSTEHTMKKLREKRVPEFETIRTLTDDMLFREHLLLERDNSSEYGIDIDVVVDKKEIRRMERSLSSLLEKYNDLPDKSYPFRHAIIINHEYDKLNKDWMHRTHRFLSKKIRPLFGK